MLLGLLIGTAALGIFALFKSTNDSTPPPAPAPLPWYLSHPASIFFISVAALGSVSLALNGQGYSATHLTINQVFAVDQALVAATGGASPADTSGKVYIRKGAGLNGDDEAVIIEPDILKGYTVHVVSLKANGTMTSPFNPADSEKPFFVPAPQGWQINPAISLPSILSLTSVAANAQINPTSQVAALNIAASQSHDVTYNPPQ